MHLYHVTFTKNVKSILRRGLRPMCTSNWTSSTGQRLGGGQVHAFENYWDAVRWGAKMEWEFYHSANTGKIAIIAFNDNGDWTVDIGDPVTQVNYSGRWLRADRWIPPSLIESSEILTSAKIRELIQLEREKVRCG